MTSMGAHDRHMTDMVAYDRHDRHEDTVCTDRILPLRDLLSAAHDFMHGAGHCHAC